MVVKVLKKFFKKEIKREFKEIGEPDYMMPGLVPLNDSGFYVTPEEPADPTDCDRYPDSPWCGGNPFSIKPIDLGLEIVIDDCNVGIRANPVLAFIKLPLSTIVYRKPECRNPLPEPKPDYSGDDFSSPVMSPPDCRVGSGRSLLVMFTDSQNNYTEEYFTDLYGNATGIGTIREEKKLELISFDFYPQLLKASVPNSAGIYSEVDMIARFKTKSDYEFIMNDVWNDQIWGGLAPAYNDGFGGRTIREGEFYLSTSGTGHAIGEPRGDSLLSLVEIHFGKTPRALERLAEIRNVNSTETFYDGTRLSQLKTRSHHNTVILKCGDGLYDTIRNPPPPKERRKKKKEDDVTCCPTTYANNALLKQLLAKVNKLSDIVGVNEYPASLPNSLISKDEGFIGSLIPNANVNIPNLTKMLGWYFERFDEVMGQFEIPIEVKDSDPTTPGEQPVGFKLPNIAESIAEMMGLLLQSTINSETLVNMATRTLIETGQDKQQNFKNYMLTQAIVEYMGFEIKDKVQKLPMTFKPGGEGLEAMLQEGEIDVTISEFADTTDLRANLTDLLQAAAITRAVHWRKLDAKGNMGNQIRDIIKAYSAISETIGNRKKDDEGKDDFEKFVEAAEIGFTTTVGITDTTNPYGASFDQRPKIRELGTPPPPPE